MFEVGPASKVPGNSAESLQSVHLLIVMQAERSRKPRVVARSTPRKLRRELREQSDRKAPHRLQCSSCFSAILRAVLPFFEITRRLDAFGGGANSSSSSAAKILVKLLKQGRPYVLVKLCCLNKP